MSDAAADEEAPASRDEDQHADEADEQALGAAAEEDSSEDADEQDEPRDQLGIPMRREPTLDDVRSDGEQHRQLAFGCTLLISLAVVLFWLVRGVMLSE